MAADDAEVEVPPRSKRCWRCASISSTRPSVACWSAAPSRARSPPRRRTGAGTRGDAGDDPARRPRPPATRPPGPRATRGRRRLPLPPPVDPRCRLRRPPQGNPCRPARAASETGSTSTDRNSSSGRRSSATTSSRPPATSPSWTGLTPRSPSERGGSTHCRRATSASIEATSGLPPCLLERALALTRPLRSDVPAEMDLAQALWTIRQRAAQIAEAATRRAGGIDDETGEALARAMAATYRFILLPRLDG